ncbi:DUF6266 family protein [Formosa sp. A9]|uniref:DUF6266 family protein n=1 Tax=Formosa sp. A9 TaxID=3442641 RepID=UPI003EBEE6FE
MATFEKGILGGFSGKVGNVVGSRWRGKNVMRSLPQRGNYTPTEKQAEQREKFKIVISFLTPIKSVLSLYFGSKQGDKSCYNMATSYHLREALVAEPLGYSLDFTKVLISKGDLRGIDSPTLAAAANQNLNVGWADNSGQGNASAFDVMVVVVYAPGLDTFYTNLNVATRDQTSATLNLPPFMAGFQVAVWATFVQATGTHAAISTYLGEVTVQ